VPLYHYMMLEV